MTRQVKVSAAYSHMPHYQVYYWLSLRSCSAFSIVQSPWWYKAVPSPDLALDVEAFYQQIRGWLGKERLWDRPLPEQFVATYRIQLRNRSIQFAIDSHDTKEIASPELLKNSDLYFKANKWKNETYPANVYPVVNGNGFLRPRHLAKLRAMRGKEKSNDFLFISRIWGGVEHNVRLFETLADLPCKKRLVAIFVQGTATDQATRQAVARLKKLGVHCAFSLVPVKKLWEEMATSRVVMLRAGKHMCIPWRMIDLLCMGACVVSDADFEPEWPAPLVPGQHYYSAGIQRPGDTSSASSDEYIKVKEAVAILLGNSKLRRALCRNSANYFDRYAAPEKVGEYILSKVMDRCGT